MGNVVRNIVDKQKFLAARDKEELLSLTSDLPDDQSEFVYEKFTDAKRQVEDIYMSIAFRNSADGQALIKTVLETIKQ